MPGSTQVGAISEARIYQKDVKVSRILLQYREVSSIRSQYKCWAEKKRRKARLKEESINVKYQKHGGGTLWA